MRKFTMLASIGVRPEEEGDINISGNNSTWDKTERRGDKRNNDVVSKSQDKFAHTKSRCVESINQMLSTRGPTGFEIS